MLPVLAGAGGDSWGGLLGLPGPRWRPQFELSTPRSEPVVRGGKGGPELLTDSGALTHSHLTPQGQGGYLLRLSLHRCAWPCEQVGGERGL